MSPEQVARKYQFREGFRLVDYGEVGLPVFRLTLEAVTMAHRPMPTIQEFVMRCLALGEVHEPDVARMLGLKVDLVSAAMDVLVEDGYALRQPLSGERHAFKLTEEGEERLKQDKLETPQEEMLVIDYDGIRRVALRLTGESVVRAAELQASGAVQIRPYPAEAPSIDELSIPEVAKVIRRHGGEDFRRTVLALKRVVRRNNVFREAVALVFASEASEEIQVAFALEGKLAESHERAFAQNGGPRKMGFVRSVATVETRKRLERLVGRAMIRRMPEPAALKLARAEESDALAEVVSIEPAASRVARPNRLTDPAVAALAAAQERLQLARYALNLFEVRPLASYEQMELFDEALQEARRSLMITSAGLQGSILNGTRMRALDGAVASRVSVAIETLLVPQITSRSGDHYDPLAEISKRAEKGLLTLTKGAQREFYFLVQDDELAVVSNRPFLGEVSRRSGFICVDGIVTRRPDLVEEIRRLAMDQESNRRGR